MSVFFFCFLKLVLVRQAFSFLSNHKMNTAKSWLDEWDHVIMQNWPKTHTVVHCSSLLTFYIYIFAAYTEDTRTHTKIQNNTSWSATSELKHHTNVQCGQFWHLFLFRLKILSKIQYANEREIKVTRQFL